MPLNNKITTLKRRLQFVSEPSLSEYINITGQANTVIADTVIFHVNTDQKSHIPITRHMQGLDKVEDCSGAATCTDAKSTGHSKGGNTATGTKQSMKRYTSRIAQTP